MKSTTKRWLAWGGGVTAVAVALVLYRPGAGPDYRIDKLGYGVADVDFARSLAGVLGVAPTGGNRIEALQNGDEIFPAMLEAIRGAESTVNFETYIYWSGAIADTFAEALADRAAAGIDVNVLIDAVGGQQMETATVEKMEQAGASVQFFHEPAFYQPKSLLRANHRTHRKLLIVDGRVGFLGGVGIGDSWQGDARNPDEWREVHFRVTGPVVASLQSAFSENWIEATGELLHGVAHYPELAETGSARAIVVASSPEGESGRIQTMFLLAIAGARDSIRIATPYFVPDELTLDHLLLARQRGVTVEIIVPGEQIDTPIVRVASRRLWRRLLEAGVSIHEYQPTMFHCKYMIVDDAWTSIGSANLDNRSFKLNDEANLVVLDPGFGADLARTFEEDRDASELVTLEAWSARPWHVRLKEAGVAFLREHL